MSHVICIANFDKQSGKTSAVVNFAASLAVLEKKTLVVDCDPEGKTSDGLLAEKEFAAFGLVDVLTGIVGGRSAVAATKLKYLDIIPYGEEYESLSKQLSMNPEKEKILSIVIEKFKDDYDYIVFDTPSENSLLSKSAILAGDSLLIPVKPGPSAAEGVYDVLSCSGKLRHGATNPLKLAGIFFNHCHDLFDIQAVNLNETFKDLKKALFPVTIPPSPGDWDSRQAACLTDMKSPYAEAFFDLCFEFLFRDSR